MEEEFKQKQHETMIRVLKTYLENQGYNVKQEPQTTEYAGVRADLEAIKEKESLCIEVVNGKEINTPQVRAKWEAISGNRKCEFCLFVPKDKEKQVKELLEKWAIYFRKLWVYAPDKI
jgi:hypothetical protein